MTKATDFFTSTPDEGTIERDWTDKTLVLDLKNSIGEHYHFENQPGEEDKLPVRSSTHPAMKDIKHAANVLMVLPIATGSGNVKGFVKKSIDSKASGLPVVSIVKEFKKDRIDFVSVLVMNGTHIEGPFDVKSSDIEYR